MATQPVAAITRPTAALYGLLHRAQTVHVSLTDAHGNVVGATTAVVIALHKLDGDVTVIAVDARGREVRIPIGGAS